MPPLKMWKVVRKVPPVVKNGQGPQNLPNYVLLWAQEEVPREPKGDKPVPGDPGA